MGERVLLSVLPYCGGAYCTASSPTCLISHLPDLFLLACLVPWLVPARSQVFASGGMLYDTPGLHLHHRVPHLLTPAGKWLATLQCVLPLPWHVYRLQEVSPASARLCASLKHTCSGSLKCLKSGGEDRSSIRRSQPQRA